MGTQRLNHLLKISAGNEGAKNQIHRLNSPAPKPSHRTDFVGKVQHPPRT